MEPMRPWPPVFACWDSWAPGAALELLPYHRLGRKNTASWDVRCPARPLAFPPRTSWTTGGRWPGHGASGGVLSIRRKFHERISAAWTAGPGAVAKGDGSRLFAGPGHPGAWRFHHALEDYGPTPLVRLNGLAEELGLGGVFVKDESHRFGLNAFKGLGGIYALSRAVARELGLPAEVTLEELQAPSVQKEVRNMVFVTTTDGNHGGGGWRPGARL